MSIVSHSRKFIFIKPRKVGGTSLFVMLSRMCAAEDLIYGDAEYSSDGDRDRYDTVHSQNAGVLLDDAGLILGHKHPPPEVVRRQVGADVWNRYFKFTVVRNPWDWFLSVFWYRRHLWSELCAAPSPSLAMRIFNVRRRWRIHRGVNKTTVALALRKGWLEKNLAAWPSFYFLDGALYADAYLRFEDLQGGYDALCRRLSLPAGTLLRTNTEIRPHGSHYRDCYTPWSRDCIARRFGQIIETFGYRF